MNISVVLLVFRGAVDIPLVQLSVYIGMDHKSLLGLRVSDMNVSFSLFLLSP